MASLLGKILGGLKANKSVLGVDISSSSIKVVQVRYEKGRAVLETYGELALGPYTGLDRGQSTALPIEKMVGALKDLLKEANVTTKNCGVAIPMSSSLINVIRMPDLGPKKLQAMVPIEMRKYIPVPISEVMIDWRIVPQDESSNYTNQTQTENQIDDTLDNGDQNSGKKNLKTTEVFVVAIHKETIENYSEIIKKAGLDTSFFEIEIFSTIRTMAARPGESIMVIDFGAGTTKVYIIENGIVRDSHVIGRGSQDITLSISKALGLSLSQAEDLKRENGLLKKEGGSEEVSSLVVSGIFSEANRVLLNYQKKFNKNVSRVFLTGGGSILKGLVDIAKAELTAETFISDPFSNLEYPAFLSDTLKKAGPEFAVSIGVAMRKLEELG